RVVTDVSFALARGECLGLLGPNGAGKTTTIRMVTCFTAPSAGTLAVLGLPTTPTNHAAIKGGLGVVQQDESLDPDLSVEQNLIVYASYFGIARDGAVPRLGTGPWRTERVSQVLYRYLRDGEAGPRVFGALDGLDFARRRATLEDVFLTLTGHALRD